MVMMLLNAVRRMFGRTEPKSRPVKTAVGSNPAARRVVSNPIPALSQAIARALVPASLPSRDTYVNMPGGDCFFRPKHPHRPAHLRSRSARRHAARKARHYA